jgi:hypothetical protein
VRKCGHNTVQNAGKIVDSQRNPRLTVQDRIAGAKKRSHWTYETGRDELDLIMELDTIRRVQAAAVSLSTIRDHKPQWYCSVQWPLLDMAFRHLSHIEPKQMYVLFHT